MISLNHAQSTIFKLMGWGFLSTSAFWILALSYARSDNMLIAAFVVVGIVLMLSHGAMAVVVGNVINKRIIFSSRLKQSLKKLKERVRFSEHRNQHITEFILEGIVVIDKESRIVFANKMACQILKLSRNSNNVTIVEAIREPEFHEIICEVVKTKKRVDRTITLSSMDQRKLLMRTRLMENDDLLIALWDITRASTVDDMQTDFLAHASHELKTPISVILANAELVIDSPHLHAGDRPLVNAIHRQALRAKILLDSLLELFRLDAGRNPVSPESVDLHQFVEDVKKSLGEIGIIMVNEIPSQLLLFTDRKLLERLALIIIENTKKYAGQNATLRLRANQQKDKLKLQFVDNGPGIKRHLRERVFERFFRQPEHDGSNTGFGLGLAQARAIATSLSAQIYIEQNSSSTGCTVAVMFPISSNCHPRARPALLHKSLPSSWRAP
ncbi:MAG TPA: ATP-binding protein [Myxococcota bacterium]|nr:ATP-binding protein [Myxococcota bacterium]